MFSLLDTRKGKPEATADKFVNYDSLSLRNVRISSQKKSLMIIVIHILNSLMKTKFKCKQQMVYHNINVIKVELLKVFETFHQVRYFKDLHRNITKNTLKYM